MAFMSVLLMFVLFIIVACLFLGGVLLCWILTIVFAVAKKRTARNVAFVIATISTLACIGIGGWFYFYLQYDTIKTEDGKEVRVNVDLTDELGMAIRQDDVGGVKKCLSEEPALSRYLFQDDRMGIYAKALESDAVQVLTYLLENGQTVDDIYPSADESDDINLVHSAMRFYFNYKSPWDGLAEMDGKDKDAYEPQIVRLLIQYQSDLTIEDDRIRPLLQDVLMCFCADGKFSEDEYLLLCEMEEAGMNMDVEFEDWDENEEEPLSYFEKMAKKFEIDTKQPEIYDQVCFRLQG